MSTNNQKHKAAASLLQHSNLLAQFFRYLAVGGLAFVVDFATLVVLVEWIGLHYLPAAACAFLCGLLTNYVLCVAWVFQVRSLANAKGEFLLFSVIGLIGLGMNEASLLLLIAWVGLDYRLAKLLTVVVVLLWNFGARKVLLFSESRPWDSDPQSLSAPDRPA